MWWEILQIVITAAVLGAACIVAALDIPEARFNVSRGLDRLYGEKSRPETAPSEDDGLFELIKRSVGGRPNWTE
jgi:hypothetical protein